MLPVPGRAAGQAAHRDAAREPGVVHPRGQTAAQPVQQLRKPGQYGIEAAGDGARHALDLGQLLGDVGDQNPREQMHLVGVEVVTALPLVEVCEELGQFGGEQLVDVEDGANLVGEVLLRGSVEVLRGVAEIAQGAVQVAQASCLNVGDLIHSGKHSLDDLEDLLAGAGDQVPVAAPVVVLEA